MSRPKYILAAYLQRRRNTLLTTILLGQRNIREWQQEVAELDAAIDAALDDGVNLLKDGPA